MRASDVIERLVIMVVLLAVFIFIDDRFGPKQNPHYLECSRIGRANVQAVEPAPQNVETNKMDQTQNDYGLAVYTFCGQDNKPLAYVYVRKDTLSPFTGTITNKHMIVSFLNGIVNGVEAKQ